jgi:hypothetical protein
MPLATWMTQTPRISATRTGVEEADAWGECGKMGCAARAKQSPAQRPASRAGPGGGRLKPLSLDGVKLKEAKGIRKLHRLG